MSTSYLNYTKKSSLTSIIRAKCLIPSRPSHVLADILNQLPKLPTVCTPSNTTSFSSSPKSPLNPNIKYYFAAKLDLGPFWLQHNYVPCSRLTDSNPTVKSIWEEARRDDKRAVMKTIEEELMWFDRWAGFKWTKRQEWNAPVLIPGRLAAWKR